MPTSDRFPVPYHSLVTLTAPDPRRRPGRQARALANDVSILDSVESVLADEGWESASVLQVAQGAGLSRRAVLNRFGDRTGSVVALWQQRLAERLLRTLQTVVTVALTPDSRGVDLAHAMAPLQHPDSSLRAAAEVLIISSHQADVTAATAESLAPLFERQLTPRGRTLSRADAARRAFVLSLALGVLVESRAWPASPALDFTEDLDVVLSALRAEVSPQRLPGLRAVHLDQAPVLDDSPLMADLLAATLDQVGRHGYEAATIDRIARACQATSGLVFGHYANKRELFLDATSRAIARAQQLNGDFAAALMAEHSPGIVDAVLTREFMDPSRHRLRTVTLEQYRLAWHDEAMAEPLRQAQGRAHSALRAANPDMPPRRARGRAFIGLARAIGMGLLANLHPSAAGLPFDVVSVPLTED